MRLLIQHNVYIRIHTSCVVVRECRSGSLAIGKTVPFGINMSTHLQKDLTYCGWYRHCRLQHGKFVKVSGESKN